MGSPGLSSKEVEKLQLQYGKNVLPAERPVPAARIFFSQFKNPLVYLLCLAGLISLFLRGYLDIILIFSVVFLNSLFGFFQEYKAQKTLLALKKLVKSLTRVARDGKRQEIDASELVPGDLVFLAAGDKIPADGKILEAVSFFVNEAILTGESQAVEKSLKDEVFMGTMVASGRAVMRVTKIGLATKIGEVAEAVKETVPPPTTLQRRLKKLTRLLIYFSLLLSALVFGLGLLTGQGFWQTAQVATVLFVAIIPEALLIVITLILVISMQKTLKRKALVRKLLAVETLGAVTTICTDKTGTLTEGKMKVAETNFTDRQNSLRAMCLCNDQSGTEEVALWAYLEEQKDFSLQETADKYKRIEEISFSSEYKFMATVSSSLGEKDGLLLVKGAPEIVLSMSNLSEPEQKLILEKIDKWANQGLKILGLAFQKVSKEDIKKLNTKTLPPLEWGGIVGLWDPPREEVKEALLAAKKAGIKVKVVTGDYRLTAEKIMEFLGMGVKPNEVLEGAELEKLTDEELQNKVADILLFARVTPHQKLRIVKVLQELGEIVAMTGDGVNDAPALKKSDIGIVVGEATEVAKETADLILLDSNFKTIISAVEEGRIVFENIKKVLVFMLSDSFAEVVLILGATLLGWPLPLTVVQILWIHLLCDGPEDIVLGFEPGEKEVMREGPKKIEQPLLGKVGASLIFLISSLSGFFALALFWYYGLYQQKIELGQTLAFMAISFDSILTIFCCRSFRKPFWRYENFWSNKPLFATVIFSLALLILATYLPLTQNLLRLVPLGLTHWALLLSAAVAMVLAVEIVKAKLMTKPIFMIKSRGNGGSD